MRTVLTVFPNSHEAARGYRGPATVEAQGQGVVCRSVVRNDRRGSTRGLGMALQQRQGSSCAPEEISIPNLEVDCCHRSTSDDQPIRTRSSIDANVTSLSQGYLSRIPIGRYRKLAVSHTCSGYRSGARRIQFTSSGQLYLFRFSCMTFFSFFFYHGAVHFYREYPEKESEIM